MMMRMVMDDGDGEDNIAMLLVTKPAIVRPLGFARVQLHVQAIRSRIEFIQFS